MNFEDFIKLLTKRYGAPKNEQVTEDLRKYFFDRRINYDTLYDLIVENYEYETFPNLAKIKSISSAVGSHKGSKDKVMEFIDYQKQIIDDSKSYSVEKILKTIKAIRAQQEKRTLRTVEISFLHYWSSLENFAGILKDKLHLDGEIYRMCLSVKDRICQGNDDNSYRPEDELEGNRTGLHKAAF